MSCLAFALLLTAVGCTTSQPRRTLTPTKPTAAETADKTRPAAVQESPSSAAAPPGAVVLASHSGEKEPAVAPPQRGSSGANNSTGANSAPPSVQPLALAAPVLSGARSAPNSITIAHPAASADTSSASHRRQAARAVLVRQGAAPGAEEVSPAAEAVPAPPPSPPREPLAPPSMPIDLPTALRLANADNLQVAVAREQIRQALAGVAAANVLWLPSIRTGVNYDRHAGSIQDVVGNQFNTSRSAFYSGLGAGVFGAGPPLVPGVYANFNLADAFFQPLAARQFTQAQRRAAAAVTNDTLLSVSQAYLELLRSNQDYEIARGIKEQTERLAEITADYARTGQGLQSDADRLHVELTLRKNDVFRAEGARQVAATRLAQLLHLDPTLDLQPIEPVVIPIDLVPVESDVRELVARGLSARPELSESRALVSQAVSLMRRERFAPLVPSVLLGTSYGAMSAGVFPSSAPATGRLDFDAVAYWELRALGLGDRAARQNATSALRQAQLRQIATMDLVAREVTEALAQSRASHKQIEIAREGVEAALQSYERNVARIEQGKGLPIEVMQSVQALSVARREYLRTLIDYNTAQFALYRALGWPGGSAASALHRGGGPSGVGQIEPPQAKRPERNRPVMQTKSVQTAPAVSPPKS
ncbi:MAG TPA: TolC family protein [Pirellulales bacterium]|nr:TolC family protein [Pirellulales bacterium]